jgi:hypothetical protein
MADQSSFLARWSRLKQAARTTPALADAATPAATAEQNLATVPAELPPIESLTANSDFSVFMQPDVPEAARNAALQKLWRSDPVFANLDGLVEYGEDFAADFKSAAVVRTVYRVLQGMPGDREPPTADAEPQPADSTSKALAESAPAETVSDAPHPGPVAAESTTDSPATASRRQDNDGLD